MVRESHRQAQQSAWYNSHSELHVAIKDIARPLIGLCKGFSCSDHNVYLPVGDRRRERYNFVTHTHTHIESTRVHTNAHDSAEFTYRNHKPLPVQDICVIHDNVFEDLGVTITYVP